MTIPIHEICDRIYAVTALATLAEDSGVALLHPDHAAALSHVVGDTVALLLAELPAGIVEDARCSSDTIEITLADGAADTENARAAVAAAVAMLALAQVKIAASDRADSIVRLASSVRSAAAALAEKLRPFTRPRRISPSIYIN